jgi:hypothetical protein
MATEPEKVAESVVAPSAPQQAREWKFRKSNFPQLGKYVLQSSDSYAIRFKDDEELIALAQGHIQHIPLKDWVEKEAEISRLTADRDHSNSLVDSLRHERNVLQKIHGELEAVNASLTQQFDSIREICVASSAKKIETDYQHAMWLADKLDKIHDIAREGSLAKGEKAQK